MVRHAEEALFSRVALQEYTLLIAQSPSGGLRDKPGKPADAYHTHYNLCGLSTAQNRPRFSREKVAEVEKGWRSVGREKGEEQSGEKDEGKKRVVGLRGEGEGEEMAEERMKRAYAWALGWEHPKEGKLIIGDKSNELVRLHSLLYLPSITFVLSLLCSASFSAFKRLM